jgi:hypothetical protein
MEPIVKGQVMGPAGELVAREMALPLPLPELPLPMPGMPGMGVEVVPDMPVPDPGMPVMDEVGVVVIEGMVPALVGVPVELFIAGMAPPGSAEGSLLGIDGIDGIDGDDDIDPADRVVD